MRIVCRALQNIVRGNTEHRGSTRVGVGNAQTVVLHDNADIERFEHLMGVSRLHAELRKSGVKCAPESRRALKYDGCSQHNQCRVGEGTNEDTIQTAG